MNNPNPEQKRALEELGFVQIEAEEADVKHCVWRLNNTIIQLFYEPEMTPSAPQVVLDVVMVTELMAVQIFKNKIANLK